MANTKYCVMFKNGIELILETDNWPHIVKLFAKDPVRSLSNQGWITLGPENNRETIIFTNDILFVKRIK